MVHALFDYLAGLILVNLLCYALVGEVACNVVERETNFHRRITGFAQMLHLVTAEALPFGDKSCGVDAGTYPVLGENFRGNVTEHVLVRKGP
ncbi:hypothetical protein ACFL6K_06690 [Candidatus Latescibacterota bacterium]